MSTIESSTYVDGISSETVSTSSGVSSFAVLAALTLAAWAFAVISVVQQKMAADSMIADDFDISAVQIQQINGSVTAHALMVMVIAVALTVPLLLVVAKAVVNKAK